MIVAPGMGGVLGVLPRHAPLMTLIVPGEVVVKKEGQQDRYFAVGGGFMEVRPDKVILLARSGEEAEEIDIARAQQARREAEESWPKLKWIPRNAGNWPIWRCGAPRSASRWLSDAASNRCAARCLGLARLARNRSILTRCLVSDGVRSAICLWPRSRYTEHLSGYHFVSWP